MLSALHKPNLNVIKFKFEYCPSCNCKRYLAKHYIHVKIIGFIHSNDFDL